MNLYPKYEPMKWNKNFYIRKSHNCYAYALNLIYPEYIELCKKNNLGNGEYCKLVRPQPGLYSGYKKIKKNANIEKRMLKDNPYIKKADYYSSCPSNYYKIALFAERNKKINYHFYREDKNKLWSHKDGWTKATNKDLSGNIIKDPAKCDRGIYNLFIGYYFVPIDPKLKNMANYYTM
uniref:Uncharacterized protein n=1 Tax=viral metagenome TaxID=1070528 RepID=A0A6C0J0F2_9ZZZZ